MMPILYRGLCLQLGNKVKVERIIEFIRNRELHFERNECFSAASCKVLCEFLTEAKISVFSVERRLYNYNIDAYVCNV